MSPAITPEEVRELGARVRELETRSEDFDAHLLALAGLVDRDGPVLRLLGSMGRFLLDPVRGLRLVVARLRREPVLSRVGIAAVLNLAVVSGLIDSGQSEAIETAALAVANAVLALGARARVTPTSQV